MILSKVKSGCISVVKELKKPKYIAGLIITFFLFICGNIFWPSIKKALFDHVTLAATISPTSTIFIDGKNLNLEIKVQLTNHTPHNIGIYKFLCYNRKNNLWTKIRLATKRAGELEVLNFNPLDEMAKTSLPREAFGLYHVYVNIPLPQTIDQIKAQWELNDYQLTYQQLIEKVDLPEQDIVLVVKTNPEFEDDAIIHLFRRQP